MNAKTATYAKMKTALSNALKDLSILANEHPKPFDVSWQDKAKSAEESLYWIASMLAEARAGNAIDYSRPLETARLRVDSRPLVFPSPRECMPKDKEIPPGFVSDEAWSQ